MTLARLRVLPFRFPLRRDLWREVRLALEDPVLDRELRSWMRGGRSRWMTGSYAVTMSLAVLALYGWLGLQYDTVDLRLAVPAMAQDLWTWGCMLQAFLLPFFVPAFTAGAVTREREQEMLELLLLSRLSALQICVGKLRAGVSHGLLLLAVSVPPLSLSFVLGSVTPPQVLHGLTVLSTCVLFSGALGLFASCVAPRTIAATAWSYLVLGVLSIGMPILLHTFGDRNLWSGMTSDIEIAGMLAAFMVGTLPLAFLTGGGLLHASQRLKTLRKRELPPLTRLDWLRCCGGVWCVTALVLWAPGMQQIILSGRYLLLMHPGTVILSTAPSPKSLALASMPPPPPPGWTGPASPWEGLILAPLSGLTESTVQLLTSTATFVPWLTSELWWISSLIYLGMAGWLFLAAVLRVRRLRVE